MRRHAYTNSYRGMIFDAEQGGLDVIRTMYVLIKNTRLKITIELINKIFDLQNSFKSKLLWRSNNICWEPKNANK